VSKDAYDLLKKMLNTSPNKRISAKDAIQHKWFQDEISNL